MTSGEEVKSIRMHLGYTQEEFAFELGVTVKSVSRWEGGHNEPHKTFMQKMRIMRDDKRRVHKQ